MVHAVVDSLIRLDASAVHPRALEILRRALTFPNPEYVRRLRFDRWVGATPEEISLLEVGDDGRVTLPRGGVGHLRESLAAAGQSVVFEDRRVRAPVADLRLRLELRDYQQAAAAALARGVQGCVVLPCGSGKTVVAAATLAAVGQRALVLVHTHDLAEQWQEAVRRTLGSEAAVHGEASGEEATVTVALVQALAAMEPAELRAFGRRFGAVVVDEAHHVPALTFREVLGALPAKYRFGLTATPERPDGLTPLLNLGIGPTVYRIGHDELVDAGHLIVPKIVPVATGCAPAADAYSALVQALIADDDRNGLVCDLVAGRVGEGRTVLILSARVDHCETLAAALRERGVAAEALTGRVPRRRRAEVLGRFRDGETRALCATSLADEGLDVPALDAVVLATPARAEGRTVQRLGRLMRPHPGKNTPTLYDLVDEHPLARRQFAARRRAYRKVVGDTVPTQPVVPRELGIQR